MCNSLASCIDWVSLNKEWLFSGVGLLVLSILYSLFPWISRLLKNQSPARNSTESFKPGETTARWSINFSAFPRAIALFYRWLVDRVRTIRARSAEEERRRNRSLYREMGESTVFFSRRFARAFPGCRGVLVIDDPAEAVRRLELLLREPLSVRIKEKGVSSRFDPIWLFRGWQHEAIRSYKKIKKCYFFPTNDILLNDEELHRVRRVVAIGSTAYWANTVYVETVGVPPSGLYDHGLSDYDRERGYSYEEVGIYKGRFIRREEYDDGAAVINGKVVQTRGKARLQARYLSPFNFFIVPIASPINDNKYDRMFEKALKGVLRGEVSVEELASVIRRLPRNPKEDIIEHGVREDLAKQ
jgi:hypothetical protein